MTSSDNCFYVYVIFRRDAAVTPCYVGKGKGLRIEQHEKYGKGHKNRYLGRIIAKYGIVTVKVREGLSEPEAFETERALIAALGRYPNGPLANLTDGGEGCAGLVHTAEMRAKQSATHKGKPKSEEHRRKIGAAHKGRVIPPEQRAKLSAAKKGVKVSDEVRARMSASRKGKPHTEAQRLALLEAQSRPEVRAKMSASQTGRRHSPETLEKLRAAHERRRAATPPKEPKPLRIPYVVTDEHREKLRIAMKETWDRRRKGELEFTVTEETRAKMRAAQEALWETQEHRIKMSEALRGHAVSEDAKRRIRESNLAAYRTPEVRARHAEGQRRRHDRKAQAAE